MDSDVDSDAGSTSHRFSLGQNMHPRDNSDSETDGELFQRKKGKEDDDIGIDDISEHSSDEIDSDSDGGGESLVQKIIKKKEKRKKRKIEAMKKAQ